MVHYQYLGVVTHFFDRISVAVIRLDEELFMQDWILIEGPQTQLEQQVLSMQIDHQPIEKALPGQEVAIKVDGPVRERDEVFLIVQE